MASRNNIGKIAKAIEAGLTAFENIDFGPEQDLNFDLIDQLAPTGDWTIEDKFKDIFVMSVHAWGSTKYKVGK